MNAWTGRAISGGSDWAAQQMAEFLSVVTSYRDEANAERSGVERIAESLEAEVGAIVRKGKVVTAIGFPEHRTPVTEIIAVANGDRGSLEVEGVGVCQTATVPLEDDHNSRLIVARFDDCPFTTLEMNLLRGMARVLALGLKTSRLVQSERTLRERTEAQGVEIQERQRLFERLTKIQRSISHRAEVQEVFDAITSGASELMGEEDAIIGLRLLDPDDPDYMILVSASGVAQVTHENTKRTPVGLGAGGQAIVNGELAIIEDYATSGNVIPEYANSVHAAMAAPVHEHGKVVGSLVFASTRPDRTYSQSEQDIILAFAEHASLALSDARTVAAQHKNFHESLSEITSKAATEKKNLEEQLRQAQKMEAIGRLAGGIAHDFNNLLMVIQTSAYFVKESLDEKGEDTEDATEILKASDRASRLVRQLLTFSRKEVTKPKAVDINGLVSDMSDLLRRTIGVEVELQVDLMPDGCVTEIDPSHMEQIVMNLAINARDAMAEGGQLSIRTLPRKLDETQQNAILAPGDYVCLEVQDDGCGMTQEVAERIFEPFFTTKVRGQGTGLGLATVYGIVSSHGGTIEVLSEPDEGTRFTVLLPQATASADSEVPNEMVHSGQDLDNSAVIMVVDDEVGVRQLVSRLLSRNGYTVVAAESGQEALGILARLGPKVDLVLSDVAMPEMSGIELAQAIREQDPTLAIVLMSGYADDRIADPSIIEDVAGFLEKPFKEEALLKTLSGIKSGSLGAVA